MKVINRLRFSCVFGQDNDYLVVDLSFDLLRIIRHQPDFSYNCPFWRVEICPFYIEALCKYDRVPGFEDVAIAVFMHFRFFKCSQCPIRRCLSDPTPILCPCCCKVPDSLRPGQQVPYSRCCLPGSSNGGRPPCYPTHPYRRCIMPLRFLLYHCFWGLRRKQWLLRLCYTVRINPGIALLVRLLVAW